MALSLIEAVARLLPGSRLSWSRFEDHKSGAITLASPGQRRLFEFLLSQKSPHVAEANERLFDGLLAAWAHEAHDPAGADIHAGSRDGCGGPV